MKYLQIIIKTIFITCLIVTFTIFGMVIYLNLTVNKDFKIKRGENLNFDSVIPITAVYEGAKLSQSTRVKNVGEEFTVDLKAFGLIPFSAVNVEVVDELHVAVLGTPFGMKLYTEGVLVIDLTSVDTLDGNIAPAEKSGIKKGDYIISVNNTPIFTNEDLSNIVEKSDGKLMHFKVKRDKKIHDFAFSAVKSKDSEAYKIGLWVRDSTAGIGTLTFYSPLTGVVCGLGHGVCDEDTGTLLNLNSGQLISADIISVEKGEVGSPGQLKGKFTYDILGDIDLNCDEGVYSNLKGKINLANLTEVALKQEIKDGDAQILSTINGSKPELYKCKIKKRNSALFASTQNLVVTITDKRLLSITGGIVQGMSGSPILQNGKLVGAVTHVLIDDPTSGYGIYAENMLKNTESIRDSSVGEVIKDAS